MIHKVHIGRALHWLTPLVHGIEMALGKTCIFGAVWFVWGYVVFVFMFVSCCCCCFQQLIILMILMYLISFTIEIPENVLIFLLFSLHDVNFLWPNHMSDHMSWSSYVAVTLFEGNKIRSCRQSYESRKWHRLRYCTCCTNPLMEPLAVVIKQQNTDFFLCE